MRPVEIREEVILKPKKPEIIVWEPTTSDREPMDKDVVMTDPEPASQYNLHKRRPHPPIPPYLPNERKYHRINAFDWMTDDEREFHYLCSVIDYKNSLVNFSQRGGGAVFVHWGRINCSSTTELVYSGVAGGGLYSHKGSAINLLCMTPSPVWGRYGTNAGSYTFLYGTEYSIGVNRIQLYRCQS